MKIVFLGAGAFGIPALQALAASEHKVCAVITQPDKPAGRGKSLTPTPIATAAESLGLPILKTADANAPDILALIGALDPDCLVVIAFGQKLSPELLALAPHQGINLHSSLLPKYRGAAPINWAVINNDAVAGVCVIEVTAVMDGGRILDRAQTPIAPDETAGELHDRLALLGAPLLPQVLEALAEGIVQRQEQDLALVTKAPKLSRQIAWVDFTQPAAVVSARIRGLSPWPGVAVEVIDPTGKVRTTATILKCLAHPLAAGTPSAPPPPHPPEKCGAVLADRTIACGQGSLEIITIQPTGKKPMDLKAFANGYQLGPGWKLRSVIPCL